jgi:hypothetical protein
MQQPARPVSVDHGYTSFCATPEGETHLRRVDVRLEPSDFAPPAQPLLLGKAQPAAPAPRCIAGRRAIHRGAPGRVLPVHAAP